MRHFEVTTLLHNLSSSLSWSWQDGWNNLKDVAGFVWHIHFSTLNKSQADTWTCNILCRHEELKFLICVFLCLYAWMCVSMCLCHLSCCVFMWVLVFVWTCLCHVAPSFRSSYKDCNTLHLPMERFSPVRRFSDGAATIQAFKAHLENSSIIKQLKQVHHPTPRRHIMLIIVFYASTISDTCFNVQKGICFLIPPVLQLIEVRVLHRDVTMVRK